MTRWTAMIALAAMLGRAGAAASDAPVRLPVGVKGPKLLKAVQAKYPPPMLKRRASGVVFLDCIIGLDGRVESIELLGGAPEFGEEAIKAVRTWSYEPPVFEGRHVRLAEVVSVFFSTSPGPPQALLLRALNDPNPLVRERATQDLVQAGNAAVDPLVKVLEDDNPRVRTAAARGLGRLKRDARKALPALKHASLDADPAVRDAAAWAIEVIGSK